MTVRVGVRGSTPEATRSVPLPLRPLVWSLAVTVLPLRVLGRAVGRFLEAYERGAEAAWRAVVRAAQALGRALVRVLGPVGRLLRRLVAPVWRAAARLWDRAGLWLTLRLLRPLGRAWRVLLARWAPTVDRLVTWGRAVVARLEPVVASVERVLLAVDRRVDRLCSLAVRVWAPVARAVAVLTPRRASGG